MSMIGFIVLTYFLAILAASSSSCIITNPPRPVNIYTGEYAVFNCTVVFHCTDSTGFINWRIDGEPPDADLESRGFESQPSVNLDPSINSKMKSLIVNGSLDNNNTSIRCVAYCEPPTNVCISDPVLLLVEDPINPNSVPVDVTSSIHPDIDPSISTSTQLRDSQFESAAATTESAFPTDSANFVTSNIVSTSGTPAQPPPPVDNSTGAVLAVLMGLCLLSIIIYCVCKNQGTTQSYEFAESELDPLDRGRNQPESLTIVKATQLPFDKSPRPAEELSSATGSSSQLAPAQVEASADHTSTDGLSSKVEASSSTLITGQKSPKLPANVPALSSSKSNGAVYQNDRTDGSPASGGTSTAVSLSHPCPETQNAEVSTQPCDSNDTTELPDDDKIDDTSAKPIQVVDSEPAAGYNKAFRKHKNKDCLFNLPERAKIVEGVKQSGIDDQKQAQGDAQERHAYESEADRESDDAQRKSALSPNKRVLFRRHPSSTQDRMGDTTCSNEMTQVLDPQVSCFKDDRNIPIPTDIL